MAQEFQIPELPSISDLNPSFEGVVETLRGIGDLPTLTGSALPRIEELLGQQGKFLMPQIEGLRKRAGELEAGAQSEALRRGLTGSDIEVAGTQRARTSGLEAEAGLRGRFAIESSRQLSDLIFKAMSGDIQAATNLRTLLAQAMGEEAGARRDIMLFREQLAAGVDIARRGREAGLIGAGIGAVGSIGGAALGSFLLPGPGTAAGAAIGGKIGSSLE